MKRLAAVIAAGVFLLTGCSTRRDAELITNDPKISKEYAIITIVEDPSTHIVYIDNTFYAHSSSPAHVYTPYYSDNGKLCVLRDGKIVEVEE